ncbi:DUF2336 domain-containing protein [Kordiimonas pumila]|uniref:DUF2336 domain-containing protein n=1 Tax=Kordiimonas pumila TaxID=2161677 RepID=A0ABV7D646_9PROT|nr:DUF2336 domain-containing protein [Kordiimonas pumila]
MQFASASLVDAVKMEKIQLAKRIGQYLNADQADEDRALIEDIARKLASDISRQVREVLAYELRRCNRLVPDLAEKIAKDVEEVAGPFLQETKAISDKAMVKLIPQLQEYARVALARRNDLSDEVLGALIESGRTDSIATLVRNDRVVLAEPVCGTLVNRFSDNIWIMDQFSARADLPLSIVDRIMDKVSDHCRSIMLNHYPVRSDVAAIIFDNAKVEMIWNQVRKIDDTQIHAVVSELRTNQRLNPAIAIEMAKKGSLAFLESMLALEAGMTIQRVRDILRLEDKTSFVRLMHAAKVGEKLAPAILKLAKENYSVPAGGKA